MERTGLSTGLRVRLFEILTLPFGFLWALVTLVYEMFNGPLDPSDPDAEEDARRTKTS